MQTDQQSRSEGRAMEERVGVSNILHLSTLEEGCKSEIENDSFRDLTNAPFSLELLRRAVWQGNQTAREAWQRCLSGILRGWLHGHPRKEELGRLDSQEHYLAQAFDRFWQTIAQHPQFECAVQFTALKYLQASLQGVLVDTLRAVAEPRRIAALTSRNAGVLHRKDDMHARQWCACIQQLFPDVRERWMVSLLFHCHLSPGDIFCFSPQEFRDVQEIRHLRHEMFQRILRHTDGMC